MIQLGKIYIRDIEKKLKIKSPTNQDQDLIKIRIHKLRYYQGLINNPLYRQPIPYDRLVKVGKLTVKKIRMKNWDQFFIYFSYPRFRGLENIQITTQKVIYNFNRRKADQIVYRPEDIDRYEQERINDCEQARLFLEANGFETTGSIKELQKSKHYAVPSIGKGHIAEKGRIVETIVSFADGEQHIIDESDDAEEETNDKNKARSYLAIPDKIDNLDTRMSSIEQAFEKMTNTLTNLIQVLTPGSSENSNLVQKNNDGGNGSLFI